MKCKLLLISILSNLNCRIGILDIAEEHVNLSHPEHQENLSAQTKKVKDHLLLAEIAREHGDWTVTLGEANNAIEAGTDLSPLVTECYSRIKILVPLFSDQISVCQFKYG
jgi:hypothetical protein